MSVRETLLEVRCRLVCKELGVDPDEECLGGIGDTETDAEMEQYKDDSGMYFIPAIGLKFPRWRTYRKAVSLQIALERT